MALPASARPPSVPESSSPGAAAPDVIGALLSVAGLALVLWALIQAPVNGWSSALVITFGAAGLAVLAGFAAWERVTSHPMLNLAFFGRKPAEGPRQTPRRQTPPAAVPWARGTISDARGDVRP
jgi:hypothetical protein